MNSELETFYHSSSPQRILDKQIKPIIQHLKHFNINSLHQLKMKLHQMSSNQGITHFSKTLPVFAHPISEVQRQRSHLSKGQKQVNRSFLQIKRNSFTLSPTPKSYEDSKDKERVFIISPISKIKKHLVQGINLEQMKQALFKKRKTLNRFEQFCQNFKSKDRSPFERKKEKSRIKANQSLPSQQKADSLLNDTFRITTRRKFWRQSRTSQSGEETSSQLLNIKSIGKTIDK